MDVTAPAYDEPNFSEITTEKLTHYKVIWQKCSDILKKELQYTLTQVCDYGLEKLSADNPVFPPSPFTIENVHAFYKSCDKICDADLKEISHCPPDLYQVSFTASLGIQFISRKLLPWIPDQDQAAEIERDSVQSALEIWLHDNPGFQSANLQYQAALNEDIFTRPSQLIRVGDILSYDDGEENGVQSVRIKDYGSSAVRGEYYVVTPILDPDSLDDSCDVWATGSKMQDWLQCRVNVEDEVDG